MATKNKILVSGCSFITSKPWTEIVWPDADVTNMAKSGASNRWISDSIISTVDLAEKPDFVFILWSGLNKMDLVLPRSTEVLQLAKQWKFYGELDNCVYLFDGGDHLNWYIEKNYNNIKENRWPEVKNFADFWKLDRPIREQCIQQKLFDFLPVDSNNLESLLASVFSLYRLNENTDFINDVSLRAISECCTFLEYHNIPYRFGFAGDFFADYADSFLIKGKIKQSNIHFGRIPWHNYVKLSAYEFGLKHNLIAPDGLHLTDDGILEWAKKLKQHI
jgi:hypothetical protein